ncbi:cytochrome c [Chloroflexi bacterium TSY]|nr:cytochrome c [Chloroflexi bacterium TSY]
MARIEPIVKHKLGQFVLVLVLAYLLFRYGIPILSGLLTNIAAPVPAHLLWTIYMPIVALVMLLFVSSSEDAWQEFTTPLVTLAVDNGCAVRGLRIVIMILLPLLAGYATFNRLQSEISAPAELRSIHPADPGNITVGGEAFTLQGLRNPLRDGEGHVSEADLEAGKALYVRNCMYCHGDALDGNGMYADGLNPRPANFTDSGTIAQLSESYVFWRVAKGGPGLPVEGKPWNSAMPAWEDELSPEEIWQVVAYLYEGAGPNIFPAERAVEAGGH